MPTSVREIMHTDMARLPATASVREAARLMRDKNIGDVIVEKDGHFCGIVTDRDIVVRAVAAGRDAVELETICSKEVSTLSPNSTDEDAVRLMREKAVRRLPIADNGKIIGIVSLGDLAMEKDPQSVLGHISRAPANR